MSNCFLIIFHLPLSLSVSSLSLSLSLFASSELSLLGFSICVPEWSELINVTCSWEQER